jgi:hypothetical protein
LLLIGLEHVRFQREQVDFDFVKVLVKFCYKAFEIWFLVWSLIQIVKQLRTGLEVFQVDLLRLFYLHLVFEFKGELLD